MNLSAKQISFLKINLIGYWISVLVAALFFRETTIGFYYVAFGGFILVAHIAETFIFNSVLQEHSKDVMMDKLLMLPFGFVIPTQRKMESQASSS